ncbi:MAG TPA: OB-fold domain-containing protein [Burkholderiales bacterium]|nr:OB-fold domain-containing protein [Burkholderiales bacterium]
MMQSVTDWTRNENGIAYQTCSGCKAVWYFARTFCPSCGAGSPETKQASGRGTVHARTLVVRAPTEELRAHAPYLIVLVDAEEGFRLMAHGDPELAIGDKVKVRFTDLAGRKIPYFEKA